MPLSQMHRPLTVVLSVQVPSPVIRAHASPEPGVGVVHSIIGDMFIIAVPPTCS
jgi:hypothetical protein